MKLLEHFKELSLHPKNAEELKGLILQSAIQGKLTANWRKRNPKVAPASEFLMRIQQAKQILISEGKLKKIKLFPPISEQELTRDLPDSWVWCRFEDIADPQPGFAFKSKEFNQEGIGMPLIRIRDLHKSQIETYYSGDFRDEFIVNNGDYLLGMDGNFNIAQWNKGNALLNQRVCRLNFLDKTLIKEVFIYSLQFRIWSLQGTKSYTTVDHLSGKQIRECILPFPPLEEQKAIVEVVKQLFTEVEQLESLTKERIQLKESFVISALTRLTESENTQEEWNFLKQHFSSFFTEKKNIKSLRETILQLAVQGKLTESWRAMNSNIEPASELLKRIEVEKEKLIAEKKIKKEKPLPPIGNDEMPYEVPDTWVWCRFGKLISFLNGYAFKSSTYVPSSNYQVIRLGNVKNDNFLVNTKEAYVPEIIGDDANGYKLYKDDILTTLTGTKNKRDYCFTCLVKDEHLEERILLLNQRVGCIRAVDKSTSELMNMFLKADTILDQLFATETGTVNQGNIGSTAFKNLVFPLPPIQEQQAIVEKVNSLMVLCDELEQQIESSQTQIEILLQSCLKEVFEYESN